MDEKFAAFLQSWLYFGLLSAVTGERIDIDSFRHRDDGSRLDSSPLKDIVPRWSKFMKYDPKYDGEHAFREWFAKVSSCLATPARFRHDRREPENKERK